MTDIALERRLLAGEGLDMVLREEWDAQQDYRSDRACDFRAKRLFLHIALVRDPSDLRGPEDQVARNVEAIGQSRFQVGCSYNAAAFNTGRLYEMQPLTRRGAHTVNTFRRDTCPAHGGSLVAPATSSGYNNNITDRALVLPQMEADPVTDEQIDAAAQWGAALRRTGLAEHNAPWHGHRCVTAKGCPGQTAYDRIPELQELTDYYTENGLTAMQLTQENLADIANAVVGRQIAKDLTVAKALRQAAKAPGVADQVAKRVTALLANQTNTAGGVKVSTEQLEEAVKQALREGTEDDGE